jgi:hypothetical protein
MIWESSYWKSDLIKIGKKLEKRKAQKKWPDSSSANTEKDIMISAFMIRKLFDSNKIDQRMNNKEIEAVTYKSNGKQINWMKNLFPERYFDLENPKNEKVKLKDICNQIVHSYIFMLLMNENNNLFSFWYVSDYNKFKYLIELKLDDYINVLNEIGNYWPTSEHYFFDPQKKDFVVFHNMSESEANEMRSKILSSNKDFFKSKPQKG